MSGNNIDFKTISYNSSDVRNYLEKYYGTADTDNNDFTTDKIFKFVSSSLTKRSFSDFLKSFLITSGRLPADTDIEDNDVFICFCSRAFKESGIVGAPNLFKNQKALTSELLRKQLKNWFSGVTPSRESVFLMAFAFKLNCDELNMFLSKGICDKMVNYKSAPEAAAYACLNMEKPFSAAVDILEKASAANVRSAEHFNVLTEEFKDKLGRIDSEDKLIQYISGLVAAEYDPRISFCISSCYEDLLQDIHDNANIDKQAYIETEIGINVRANSEISFSAIEWYLYSYIIDTNNGGVTSTSFALHKNGNIAGKDKNILSSKKWFFSTLLRRSDMQKMYCGEKKISRDTILTLAFFVVCENAPDCSAYEYISEINEYLNFCRFEEFSFYYPYDMFIFMCLQTEDPIYSFRKVWKMSWIDTNGDEE